MGNAGYVESGAIGDLCQLIHEPTWGAYLDTRIANRRSAPPGDPPAPDAPEAYRAVLSELVDDWAPRLPVLRDTPTHKVVAAIIMDCREMCLVRDLTVTRAVLLTSFETVVRAHIRARCAPPATDR